MIISVEKERKKGKEGGRKEKCEKEKEENIHNLKGENSQVLQI